MIHSSRAALLLAGLVSATASAAPNPWEPGGSTTTNPWEPGASVPRAEAPRPSPISLVVRPELGYQVGAASYAFSFPVSGAAGINGSSQLDWPLSFALAGLRARVLGDGGQWSVGLSFATNLGNPNGTLLDRDWVSNSSNQLEISHTDSKTAARYYQGDVTGRYQFTVARFRDAELACDVLLGYRHEAFFGDGMGFTGWQIDNLGEQQGVSMDTGTRVIHYEFQRGMPHVGAGVRGRLFERVLMDVDAQLLLAISGDVDDHVLRNKLSKASPFGIGMLVSVAPRWIVLGSPTDSPSIAVGANFDLRLVQLWGKLRQAYYADDPGLPGVGQDTVIPDVDTTFSSLTGSAQVVVDVTF